MQEKLNDNHWSTMNILGQGAALIYCIHALKHILNEVRLEWSLLFTSACLKVRVMPVCCISLHHFQPTLTLIAQILKLGAIIILVQYLDGELADAYERLLRPISGRYCNWILSLPLPVEPAGCHNHSCKYRRNVHTWIHIYVSVHSVIVWFTNLCMRSTIHPPVELSI